MNGAVSVLVTLQLWNTKECVQISELKKCTCRTDHISNDVNSHSRSTPVLSLIRKL